jgi:hypothetical protein
MAASKSGKALRWPPGWRRTAVRVEWHRRLSSIEPGLSIRELADRLGDAYPTASFWAKRFGYRFRAVPRGRKSDVDWSSVDWDLKNSEIARMLKVTGERVRQMRKQLKLPPAPRCSDGGIAFRRFVHKNGHRLHRWSIREMIGVSKAEISTATAHVILQQFKRLDGRAFAEISNPSKTAKKKTRANQ